jgi:OHCU decarboxylase
LTPASAAEQASAGLAVLSADERSRFDELNAAYRARFGFPFVICAREQTKTSILHALEERLKHSREHEIATALREIEAIARLRLLDAVSEN